MFGKISVFLCIVFVALAFAEMSYANPVIGKKRFYFSGFSKISNFIMAFQIQPANMIWWVFACEIVHNVRKCMDHTLKVKCVPMAVSNLRGK